MSTISGESAKEINLFPTSVWIFPPASEEELNTTELLAAALDLYRNPGTATSPNRLSASEKANIEAMQAEILERKNSR